MSNAAVAVIQFILRQDVDEGLEFLRCWNEGDFDACRKWWPDAPEECYIGADPLHPKTAPTLPTQALEDVMAERRRQIEGEGFDFKHDDDHNPSDLPAAGASFMLSAAAGLEAGETSSTAHAPMPSIWPWATSWWKPKDVRRDLVRATALGLAAIERIDRETAKTILSNTTTHIL